MDALNIGRIMPGQTLTANYVADEIRRSPTANLETYFVELEKCGIPANKFAFYSLRSRISCATADPKEDPRNRGWLILGGGEKCTDLYSGKFLEVKVLDDLLYY